MSRRPRSGPSGKPYALAGGAWIACAGLLPALAHAQTPDTHHGPAAAGDSAPRRPAVITPTVVTATRERQRRTESSATIDVVDHDEIARTRPSHPAAIMNRVAGVHVSELSAEGHSTAIRQPLTTKPMYLYLEDGIPTRATGFFNHNALYEVNIPQSAGIEVLKGPGTALYGSDAIGGVVNVLSNAPPARPSLSGAVERGGYGYERLLVTGGTRGGSHAVRADLNLTHAEGWQDAAPYDRRSGSARWDYGNASGVSVRTLATVTSVDQHDVPSVGAAQFAARSGANAAPVAFRTVRAARVSAAIEQDRGASLWSITPYARRDVLQLLPSWQISYDPQLWDTRNTSLGLLAKYRRDFDPLRTRVIAGADVDYSPGSFLAQQAVLGGASGVTSGTTSGAPPVYRTYARGATQYDYDVTYHNVSPYLHAELSPAPRLRLDAGLRYDVSGYAYDSRLAPLATGVHRVPANTEVRYRHLSPKLGVTYDVSPALNVYGSYRHGFRAPSQGQLFQQNSADNTVGLKPVRAESYEAGVRGTVASRVLYSVAAYDLRIRDDIITYVTPINTREATNAGGTRHRGIEASAGIALGHDLRLDAAYSVTDQRYVSWTPRAARPATGSSPATASVDYSGNRVEQAPRSLGNLLATYSPRVLGGGRVALEIVTVGRYYTDPENLHQYDGYRLANLHANYVLANRTELFVRVVNLANRNYAEVASYDPFQKEQYMPGAPRTVFAGARYVWTR